MSTKSLLTSEDLWKIVADGSRYELWDGELVPMTPVGFEHSAIVGRIGEFLSRHARENKLGVVGMEGGFKLGRGPEKVLSPDLHFVSRDRLLREGITQKFADYPPDLAVEVLSPDDKASDVQKKVEAYLSGGVRLTWIIEPATKTVTIYRSHQHVRIVTQHEELDGEDVVPGFRIKVSDIFNII
jgi:Uma2 family endonuclease